MSVVCAAGGARLWIECNRVCRREPGDQGGREDPRGLCVFPSNRRHSHAHTYGVSVVCIVLLRPLFVSGILAPWNGG